jgi:AraC-like DNA-binding protein
MPTTLVLPNHLRPKREKVFGDGHPRPLDRNAKVRVMTLARALTRRTEAGRHYGAVTAKALAVLEALLWRFHNARSGLCFPSYETIATAAGCARSTVAEAIKALEAAGLLAWVNRITRIRHAERDLFGRLVPRWRVIRTSNAYRFRDPGAGHQAAGDQVKASQGNSSKSDFPPGTRIQEFFSLGGRRTAPPPDPDSPLEKALRSLGKHFGRGDTLPTT